MPGVIVAMALVAEVVTGLSRGRVIEAGVVALVGALVAAMVAVMVAAARALWGIPRRLERVEGRVSSLDEALRDHMSYEERERRDLEKAVADVHRRIDQHFMGGKP